MRDERRHQIDAFYEALGSGRIEAAAAAFADDAQYIGLSRGEVFPNLGHRRGKEAIAGTMKSIRAHYEIGDVRLVFVAIDGDYAAVIALAQFRRHAGGNPTALFLAHFLRFRGDRIVEIREYVDSAEAVQRALDGEFDFSGPDSRTAC